MRDGIRYSIHNSIPGRQGRHVRARLAAVGALPYKARNPDLSRLHSGSKTRVKRPKGRDACLAMLVIANS